MEKNSCSTYLYWNNKLGLGLNHLHSLKKLSLKNISKNKKIIFYQSLLKKYNNRIEYQMNINDNLSIINGYLYFYENLEQNLKDFFYIKNYPTNNFWNSKIFFNQKFGQKVNFINQENIKKITSESKVFITDKISTPFIEMIYMNIPTLVYTNIEEYSYTENINYLFKKLKEINLIHDDAKSCVNFLNKNYTSIDNWWEMVLKMNISLN